MNAHSILDEIHEARRKLLDEVGGDLKEYMRQARERALGSGREIVDETRPTERSQADDHAGEASSPAPT